MCVCRMFPERLDTHPGVASAISLYVGMNGVDVV